VAVRVRVELVVPAALVERAALVAPVAAVLAASDRPLGLIF
jgi:hypothetical protein